MLPRHEQGASPQPAQLSHTSPAGCATCPLIKFTFLSFIRFRVPKESFSNACCGQATAAEELGRWPTSLAAATSARLRFDPLERRQEEVPDGPPHALGLAVHLRPACMHAPLRHVQAKPPTQRTTQTHAWSKGRVARSARAWLHQASPLAQASGQQRSPATCRHACMHAHGMHTTEMAHPGILPSGAPLCQHHPWSRVWWG